MARKKRGMPEVNSSSSADIAFLLLIFFLITSSMDADKGLSRRLPPPVPKDQKKEDIDVKKRNVLVVLINSANQLMVNGSPMDVKQLREEVKKFIDNPTDDASMPEKFPVFVEGFGEVMITKNHVVSLQNDRGTTYDAYFEVQNELVAAYNDLRNDLSKKKYGKAFEMLDEDQQKSIQTYYPQKISEAEPKNYGGGK